MDYWSLIFALIVIVISAFLWRTMTHFRNTGIPHALPLPFVGNMGSVVFKREHFIDNVKTMYNRWQGAKYFGVYDFIDPTIVIRDPELIKSIAVKHFDSFMDHKTFVDENIDSLFAKSLFGLKGNRWREIRQLLTPAFTSSKMKAMSGLMSTCAIDFSEYLVSTTAKDDVQIKDAFLRFTNDVIASCAFGISVDSMRNPDNDFYVLGKRATNFDSLSAIKFLIIRTAPKLVSLFNIKLFDEKMTTFFRKVIQSTMETREKEGIVRPDMLQLMIDSKSGDTQLTPDEMIAQAFIFFFGGFDTTAALMSFTTIQLSINPEIQKKLQDEIDEVMKQTKGNPSYDAVNNMAYLDAILYESLRYFSINGLLDRVCLKDFELPPALPGLKPYTVKAGTSIWFPACAIHMDPEYYSDPETYDPDRFLNQKISANQSTFLAFGLGPRACIGNRFALIENKLVLFHLLARCSFKQSPKLKVPIRLNPKSFSIDPEGGFWVQMVPRKSSEVGS